MERSVHSVTMPEISFIKITLSYSIRDDDRSDTSPCVCTFRRSGAEGFKKSMRNLWRPGQWLKIVCEGGGDRPAGKVYFVA